MKKSYIVILIVTIALGIGIFALNSNINTKKIEEKSSLVMIAEQSDENPNFMVWGRNFPDHLDDFLKMRDSTETPTEFGGSLPYNKIIRYPQLVSLWGGYPFSVDFNEERSHYYSAIDQIETKRNDKEYLNAHGFPKFKGQPATCMNCHSGWVPSLSREMGWDKFNASSYKEIENLLKQRHGDDIHGASLGSTCADCHNPVDMSLRVTRTAFINAMELRGYKKDEESGIKATRNEMRSFVCQQCHDEYYFGGSGNKLIYPWKHWGKDQPFRIEMLDTYYDEVREKGLFIRDFVHIDTKADIVKIQHPETELNSSGIHARSGVSCADCHMPYKREGASKITDHFVRSPLENINAACKTCHTQSEKVILERVKIIQRATASSLRESENALLALIQDTKKAREELAKHEEFASIKDDKEREEAISKVLSDVLEGHRRASYRWDFIFSENSTGFHSPQESARVLAQSIDLSRTAQSQLHSILAKYDIKYTPTTKAIMPKAPEVIKEHKHPVGSTPPKELIEVDAKVQKVDF